MCILGSFLAACPLLGFLLFSIALVDSLLLLPNLFLMFEVCTVPSIGAVVSYAKLVAQVNSELPSDHALPKVSITLGFLDG